MSGIDNDPYPTLGVKTEATVFKLGSKFCWKVRVHIEGPDEWAEKVGSLFNSKKEATEDFIRNYPKAHNQLFRELGE